MVHWWDASESAERAIFATGCGVSLAVAAAALWGAVLRAKVPRVIKLKMVCDLTLSAFWLAEAIGLAHEKHFCEGSRGRVLAFFSQFFLTSSELLNVAFCVSVLRTIGDPFLNLETNRAALRSVVLVAIVATASACLLISKESYYGEAFVPICYTNTKSTASGSGASLLNLCFFYLPLLAHIMLSLVTVVYVSVVLGTPLPGFDMQARIYWLRTLQRFVFAHGLYYAIILIIYLPTVILIDAPWHDDAEDVPLRLAFYTFLFLVGARSCVYIAFIKDSFFPGLFYSHTLKGGGESNTVPPALSKVLQQDVLHYTLQGMCGLLSGNGKRVVDEASRKQRYLEISNPYQPLFVPDAQEQGHDAFVGVEGASLLESSAAATAPSPTAALAEPFMAPSLTRTTSLMSSARSDVQWRTFAKINWRSKEMRLATLTAFPMIFACSLSVVLCLIFDYHVSAALLGGIAILFVVVLIVAVWRLSVARVKSYYHAVMSEYEPELFHELRVSSTSAFKVPLRDSLAESLASQEGGGHNEGGGSDDAAKVTFKMSGGRSGSFMVITSDHRWIIKTIERAEKDFVLELIPELVQYWRTNPHSSIARLAGLFSLKSYGKEFYLVVMENILPTQVDATFDLKGSWINRNAPQPVVGKVYYCKHCSMPFVYGKQQQQQSLRTHSSSIASLRSGQSTEDLLRPERCRLNRTHEPRRLLLDNDFALSRLLMPLPFTMQYKQVLKQDAAWLAQHGVMDYSLLLGVRFRLVQQEPVDYTTEENQIGDERDWFGHNLDRIRSGPGIPSFLLKGPAFYHMGVIDYFQRYTIWKKLERFFKSFVLLKNETDDHGFHGISAVDPEEYRDRFITRVVEDLMLELRDIVQVVRSSDGAPIATLDISGSSDYGAFLSRVKAICPSAHDPVFHFTPSGNDQSVSTARRLDHDSFTTFRHLCRNEELTTVSISV